MNAKYLLRIAAGLTLFTCLGHTLGHFKPIPEGKYALVGALELMKRVDVEFPIGAPKTLMDIRAGSTLSISVFLLAFGLILIFLSNISNRTSVVKIQIVTGLALLSIGILSQFYFFPLPAICTGLAGILAITAARMKA